MSFTIDTSQLAVYKRLCIGFSGGLDSTVLLHYLSLKPELKNKLHAIHINHQLQRQANEWQQHCEAFCQRLGIAYSSHNIRVDKKGSLEQNARTARYQCFAQQVKCDEALLLAHHQNDQAETLLLQLFRGAGLSGLTAIKAHSERFGLTVIRPLLGFSKDSLMKYALEHQLPWLEDDSNQDTSIRRNFIRHQILPDIQKIYPPISQTLSRNALLLNEQALGLELLLTPLAEKAILNNTLDLSILERQPQAIQTLLLHQWLKQCKLKPCSFDKTQRIFTEIIHANNDNCPHLLHDSHVITRFQRKLYLVDNKHYFMKCSTQYDWKDLRLPLQIPEFNKQLILITPKKGDLSTLPTLLKQAIRVRFRRGGEIIRINGQQKRLKKLLQEAAIPPWQRKLLPLVYVNDKLALVGEHYLSDEFAKIYGQDYRLEWISC